MGSHKIYRKTKQKLSSHMCYIKLWCIVLYYLLYGKLLRTKARCRKKLLPMVEYCKLIYMKVTVTIYRPLRVSAAVLFLWLLLSGDLELNPGPKGGETMM